MRAANPIRAIAPAILAMAAVGGCGDKGKDDTGAVCETCDCIQHPAVEDVWPAASATGVYHRTRIFATVDDDSPFASSLALADAGGAAVPATATFDADRGLIQLVPTEPLAPDTTYTLTHLTNDCPGTSSTFTTSNIGAEVPDLQALVGRTWRMSLGGGKPPPERDGLQAVLDMVEEDLLISATSLDGTTLTALVASTLSGTGQPQNLCVPTTEVALDLSANPYATGTVPPGYAPLTGQPVPTFGGQVSGSFSADGSVLAGIDLTMVLDMDAASVIMGDDLCALLVNVGVQCEPCPATDGQCLTFNTWGVDGGEDATAVVVARSQAEVDADPACAAR